MRGLERGGRNEVREGGSKGVRLEKNSFRWHGRERGREAIGKERK